MTKRAVLFGVTGLLGTELLEVLNANGFDVSAPTHAELNLTDSQAIEKYIAEIKPDVVINAAALIAVDAIEKDPLPAWQVNTVAAGAIARAASQIPDVILVHVSSQYVFSGDEPFYNEEGEMRPVNIYGQTKMFGEMLVEKYCTSSNIRYSIIRTSWIYGKTRDTFVDQVAKTLQAGKEFDASTEQHGNPTNAHDLAEALVKNCIEEKRPSGVFHLINTTPDEGVTRFMIAQEIADCIGAPQTLVVEAIPNTVFTAPRPSAVLVNTKLPALRDWSVALREYLKNKQTTRS
jgi:dTDP-4-dehydrorhamnose reductase